MSVWISTNSGGQVHHKTAIRICSVEHAAAV